MQIVIGNILSVEETRTVADTLERARFIDGRATAGFAARLVKNNQQAEGSDRSLEMVRKLVTERVLGNEAFRLAVRPKRSRNCCSPATSRACITATTSTTR